MRGDRISAGQRVLKARRLYESGKLDEALAELYAAIDASPCNSDWQFDLGLTLDAMGRFEEAILAYRHALDLNEADLDARNLLGEDLTRMGRLIEALEQFELIEQSDPGFEASYCNRIITYTQMGDHDMAETMFFLAQQIKEDCPLCYNNIGSSLYERGLYDRAIYCWRRALEIQGNYPRVNVRLAEAYRAKGDLPQARKHYLAELGQRPHDVNTLVDLAELLIESDQLAEAGEKLQRAMDLDPGCLAGHFCRGQLAVKLGRWEEAEKHFRRVASLDDAFPEAHLELGELLLRRGLLAEAQRHLLKEFGRSPGDPTTMLRLGKALMKASLPRQANELLRRLVTIDPEKPEAHLCLAGSWLMLGNADEGVRHCLRALTLRPEFSAALYSLALAYVRKGEMGQARQSLEKAQQADPRDERIRWLAWRLGMDIAGPTLGMDL